MTRAQGRRLLLCAAVAAFAAPATAAGDPPSPGGVEAPPPPATESLVSTQGPHVSLTTRAGTMLRTVARFRGSAPASEAGRTVAIERLDEATQAWTAVASATIAADGSYVARWRTDRAGTHRVRAVLSSGAAVTRRRPRRSWRSPSTGPPSPPGTAPASTAATPPAGCA